jgi:hypothetical protein
MTLSRGEDLREQVEAEYEIHGTAARSMLDTICRTADELENLESAIDEHGPLIQGARGQMVANPALAAAAKHRELLSRLLERAFPGSFGETKGQRARRAAAARRGRTPGRG